MTVSSNKIGIDLLGRIRRLSIGTEFAILVSGSFGWFFLGNVLYLLFRAPPTQVTEQHLQSLLIYESIVLVCVFVFLRLRGWTLDRIGLRPSLRETAIGLLLAVVSYAASTAAVTVFAALSSKAEQSIKELSVLFSAPIGVETIAALSIVNPIFEESLATAYVILTLKGRASFWTVVGTSVVIQLSYHLYQGPAGLIAVAPSVLIFVNFYYRTGRLWPLIVAHALLDFFGLMAAGPR